MKKIIVLFFLFISIVLTGEEFKFYEGTGDKTPFSNIDGIGKGVLDSIGTFPQKAGRLEIGTYGSISFLSAKFTGMDPVSLETYLWGSSDNMYDDPSFGFSLGGELGISIEYFLSKNFSIFGNFGYRGDTYRIYWNEDLDYSVEAEFLHLTLGAKIYLGNMYLGVAGYVTGAFSVIGILDSYNSNASPSNIREGSDLKNDIFGYGINLYWGFMLRITDRFSIDMGFQFTMGLSDIIYEPGNPISLIKDTRNFYIYQGYSYAIGKDPSKRAFDRKTSHIPFYSHTTVEQQ